MSLVPRFITATGGCARGAPSEGWHGHGVSSWLPCWGSTVLCSFPLVVVVGFWVVVLLGGANPEVLDGDDAVDSGLFRAAVR